MKKYHAVRYVYATRPRRIDFQEFKKANRGGGGEI
jgi:hypothetical protein